MTFKRAYSIISLLMKKLILFLLTALVIFSFSKSVSANYGQYETPAPSLSILIDKMVGKPDVNVKDATSAVYVDNLSLTDTRFKPGNFVFFKIKVKNTSNEKLYNVVLKDFVPSYIDPVEGPGIFDSSNRQITFNIGDMNADEERIFYMKMQVLNQNQLPNDKGLFCIINKAQASNDKTFDDDTSQLCIEKQVTAVTKTPSAGPEFGLILIGLNMLTIGAGLIIKRKTG